MKRPTEAALVIACLRYLNLRGIACWRQNNVAVYDATRQRYRAGSATPGVPDILGVLPGGRFLGVECKTATGRVTPAQAAFHGHIRAAGGAVLVVRSLADLVAGIEALTASAEDPA